MPGLGRQVGGSRQDDVTHASRNDGIAAGCDQFGDKEWVSTGEVAETSLIEGLIGCQLVDSLLCQRPQLDPPHDTRGQETDRPLHGVPHRQRVDPCRHDEQGGGPIDPLPHPLHHLGRRLIGPVGVLDHSNHGGRLLQLGEERGAHLHRVTGIDRRQQRPPISLPGDVVDRPERTWCRQVVTGAP